MYIVYTDITYTIHTYVYISLYVCLCVYILYVYIYFRCVYILIMLLKIHPSWIHLEIPASSEHRVGGSHGVIAVEAE